MKIFDFNANTRSFMDKVSGNVPVNSGATFLQNGKGHSSLSKSGFLTYPDFDLSTSDFSVVIWFYADDYTNVYLLGEYTDSSNRWYIRMDGTPVFQLYSKIGGSGGLACAARVAGKNIDTFNGLPLCLCLNVDRDNTISGFCNDLPLSHVSMTAGNLPVTNFTVGGYATYYDSSLQINKCQISNELLSDAEMHEEYQKFLHSSPTSTSTVIRPRVEVDPVGSVLCYDFQNWRGGEVIDLSPNGNNGTPSGFVDVTRDGVKFDGSTGYIESANTGMTGTNFSLEFVIKPDYISGGQYIFDHKPLQRRSVILGFQSGYFNFYSGGYPTGTASDTQFIATLNEEQHIVMQTDGTRVYAYKNGVEVVNKIGTWFTAGTTGFVVGSGADAAGNFASPWLKYVIARDHMLTPAQIATRYNEIASKVDLQVMGSNLLPDETVKTVGMAVTI